MNKKLLIACVAVVLALVATYMFVSPRGTGTGQEANSSVATDQYPEGPITVRGNITCIPKIGDGPQTMECALGLQNSDGVYFGLRDLSEYDDNYALVSPDINVDITGTLVHEELFGPDGNRYDTVGIIEIESITEL